MRLGILHRVAERRMVHADLEVRQNALARIELARRQVLESPAVEDAIVICPGVPPVAFGHQLRAECHLLEPRSPGESAEVEELEVEIAIEEDRGVAGGRELGRQ